MSSSSDWEGRESAEAFLRHLFYEDGLVYELRAFDVEGVYGKGIVSGYFDNPEDLLKEAAALDGRAETVSVTVNPVNPALLARAKNRVIRNPKCTTSDRDIAQVNWLLLDADPVRPSGIASTDKEMSASFEQLREVGQWLEQMGFGTPLKASSGNGGHACYRLSDPTVRLEDVLKAIAFRFDNAESVIDQGVGNPARLVRLYGTLNRKGDPTSDRPHRRSRLYTQDADPTPTSSKALEAVAAMGPPKAPKSSYPSGRGEAIDVPGFIERHGLEVAREGPWQGGNKWVLRVCPFNPEHDDAPAAIVQFPSGGVAFRCHHNGCTGNDWRELRARLEPNHQNLQNPSGGFGGTAGEPSDGSGGTPPGDLLDFAVPEPLPRELPPVLPYSHDLAPGVLQPWIEDITERVQCPTEYVAAAAMIALSSVVGRRLGIRPKRKDDWLVVPNLWGLACGPPGIMKSPALMEAMRPLKQLEKLASQRFKEKQLEYEAECLIRKQRKKLAEKSIETALKEGKDAGALARQAVSEEEPPVRVRYLVNDTTVEKLGEIQRDNPFGVLSFRDELIGKLRSLDKEGHESDRAFYLEGWEGSGSFTFDRIGRGTVEIEAVTLSVFGSIQPGPLRQYLMQSISNGAGNDGLMQRFQLMVWPDTNRRWKNVDREPNHAARDAVFKLFEGMANLDPVALGAEYDQNDAKRIPFLRFDDEGLACFNEWREEHEALLQAGEEHPVLICHLSKYRSLVPSLALLIHLGDGCVGPVGVDAVRRALRWKDLLESHARRIYSVAESPELVSARALAKKILARAVKSPFAARDVYHKGWASLGTTKEVNAAADLLVDLGWLYEHVTPAAQTGGRPSTRFVVNPRVFDLPKSSADAPTPPEAPRQATSKTDRTTSGGSGGSSLGSADKSESPGAGEVDSFTSEVIEMFDGELVDDDEGAEGPEGGRG